MPVSTEISSRLATLVLDRPKIRILFDADGNRVDAVEIDLQEQSDMLVQSVRWESKPALEPIGSSTPGVAIEEEEEPRPQPSASAGPREEKPCPNCGYVSAGKFCTECGTPMGD